VTQSLTIATPFAGYEQDYLGRWAEGLAALLRRTPAYVLWLDNSRSEEFNAMLRRTAWLLPVPVRVARDSLRAGDPRGQDPRLPRDTQVRLLWQHVRDLVESSHLLCVESDVFPPEDAAELLADALRRAPCLAAVSAAVNCWPAYDPGVRHVQVWRRLSDTETKRRVGASGLAEVVVEKRKGLFTWWPEAEAGVEVVDALPFGCLFLRTETLREATLQTPRFPPGYDQTFGAEMWERGRPVAVHWGVKCRHVKPDPRGGWHDLPE
jgi:hypothetical protein